MTQPSATVTVTLALPIKESLASRVCSWGSEVAQLVYTLKFEFLTS